MELVHWHVASWKFMLRFGHSSVIHFKQHPLQALQTGPQIHKIVICSHARMIRMFNRHWRHGAGNYATDQQLQQTLAAPGPATAQSQQHLRSCTNDLIEAMPTLNAFLHSCFQLIGSHLKNVRNPLLYLNCMFVFCIALAFELVSRLILSTLAFNHHRSLRTWKTTGLSLTS